MKIKGKTYTTKKPLYLVDVEYELNHSRKLQAVKKLADAAEVSLKAAKNAVDMYCYTHNWAHLDTAEVMYQEPFVTRESIVGIPKEDEYVIDAIRSEVKGLSQGPVMESIVWKYEHQYEWISDLFTIEEVMDLIEDCVV